MFFVFRGNSHCVFRWKSEKAETYLSLVHLFNVAGNNKTEPEHWYRELRKIEEHIKIRDKICLWNILSSFRDSRGARTGGLAWWQPSAYGLGFSLPRSTAHDHLRPRATNLTLAAHSPAFVSLRGSYYYLIFCDFLFTWWDFQRLFRRGPTSLDSHWQYTHKQLRYYALSVTVDNVRTWWKRRSESHRYSFRR